MAQTRRLQIGVNLFWNTGGNPPTEWQNWIANFKRSIKKTQAKVNRNRAIITDHASTRRCFRKWNRWPCVWNYIPLVVHLSFLMCVFFLLKVQQTRNKYFKLLAFISSSSHVILLTDGPVVSLTLHLFSQSTRLFCFVVHAVLPRYLFQFRMHLLLAWAGRIAMFLRALAWVFYRPPGCFVQSRPSWKLPSRFATRWVDLHRCPKTDLLQLEANTKKKWAVLVFLHKVNLAKNYKNVNPPKRTSHG